MRKQKKCEHCGTEMYQDDQEKWFCPDYIVDEMDTTFFDPHADDPGASKTPYVLSEEVGLA